MFFRENIFPPGKNCAFYVIIYLIELFSFGTFWSFFTIILNVPTVQLSMKKQLLNNFREPHLIQDITVRPA